MNSKKGIVVVGIALLVVAGLLVLGRPPAISAPGTSNQQLANSASVLAGGLNAQESQFDFGEISMRAGKVSHKFAIKNEGSEPLIIKKIYTSCMCTTASLIKARETIGPFGMPGHGPIPVINQNLAAGESAEIETVFDPAAHGPSGIGQIFRTVYLETQSGETMELKFRALVKP